MGAEVSNEGRQVVAAAVVSRRRAVARLLATVAIAEIVQMGVGAGEALHKRLNPPAYVDRFELNGARLQTLVVEHWRGGWEPHIDLVRSAFASASLVVLPTEVVDTK